ncbi:MAG: WD40/YVTN/BNR-like repeat-containing protein, partial [Planctomycetota bacterium]
MSDLLYVGTRKGLFRLERKARWQITAVDHLSVPISVVLPDKRDGSLLAALNHGHFGIKMQKSPDGVSEWREIDPPKYPEKPEGKSDKDAMGNEIEWTLKDIWSLAAGGEDQPGRVWCGTLPGGLFRSDEGGENWELVRSLWDMEERSRWFGGGSVHPAMHSILVDPRNSKRVMTGVSCAGTWLTEDDGKTWKQTANGMR